MQLGKLRFIVGVLNRTGAQTVAQRQRNVISGTDFTNFAEVLIEEIFLMMGEAPFRHNRTAARDDTGQAFRGHRHIAQQYARMDSEVIHTLLGLFQQRVAERFPGKIFGDPVNLLQRLVDRHCTDRHRAVTQNPLAGFVNIATGGEIHHRIRSPARGPYQLFHFFFDGRGDRRVADIGVNFYQEIATNNHRLRFRMINVGRDNRTSGSNFITDKFRSDIFRQMCAKAHSRMLVA